MAVDLKGRPREGDENAQFLSTEHLSKGLRSRSVRGGTATVAGQGGAYLVTIGGTAVLARVLTPSDFGLLAMVATFTRLIEQFKDMGLAMATVQRKDLSQAQVSYLFWVNALVGCAAAGVTALAAPILSWFYGEPSLTRVAMALSVGFMVAGLGVQHQALLQRQMRLGALALNKVLAASVGTAAGIAAALAGAGYWSLVVMNLGMALTQVIAVWWACGWRPNRVRGEVEGVGSMLAFGWRVTGSRLLGFFARNLDNILIGKFWGGEALGLYAKAYQLLMLPVQQLINPLTNVVVPALSRLQDNQPAYIAYYQKALRTLATLSMPLVAFSFVSAREVIGVVLGERWEAAVPIFEYLAPAAFVGAVNPTAWAWISLNQTERLLRWGLMSTPIYAAAFAVGVSYGPEGVAISFSIVQIALRYFNAAYCYRGNFLSMSILVAAVWQPTVAALVSGVLVLFLADILLSDFSLPASLALKAGGYGFAYLGAWLLLPGGPAALKETVLLARELRQKNL